MPSNAQIVIQLDSTGNLTAETTGPNGQRIKVDLPLDFKIKNPEIMAALTERQDYLNRQELARLRQTQVSNIDYVLSNHGTALARQIWHNGDQVSNLRCKRHLAGDYKIKTTGDEPFAPKRAKQEKPEKPKLNLGIEI